MAIKMVRNNKETKTEYLKMKKRKIIGRENVQHKMSLQVIVQHRFQAKKYNRNLFWV